MISIFVGGYSKNWWCLGASVSGFPESKLNPFFEKTGRLKNSEEWKGHKFSYNFNVIKDSFITENFSKSKQKDKSLGISYCNLLALRYI